MVLITGLANQICITHAFQIQRVDSGATLVRDEECKEDATTPWAALFDDAVWEELSTPIN